MADSSWDETRERQRQIWIGLVKKFYQQIRYGCVNAECQKPTCRSHRVRVSGRRPCRIPAPSSAKHWASVLASEPNAAAQLCAAPLKPMDDGDGAFVSRPTGEAFDTKSVVQQLFNSASWHERRNMRIAPNESDSVRQFCSLESRIEKSVYDFNDIVATINSSMSNETLTDRRERYTSWFEYCAGRLAEMSVVASSTPAADIKGKVLDFLVLTAGLLVAYVEPVSLEQFLTFDQAVSDGPIFSSELCKALGEDLTRYVEILENRTAVEATRKMLRVLSFLGLHAAFFRRIKSRRSKESSSIPERALQAHHVLAIWPKLAFRNSWKSATIHLPQTSDENLALEFLDEFRNHFNFTSANSQFPGPLGFVARSLDVIKDTVSWMRPPERLETIHILKYNWVFSLKERLILFRSANYFLMLGAFEKAMEVSQMVARTHGTVRDAASSQARHQQIFERIKPALTAFLVLQIRRENILEDALSQLWRREKRELRRPLKIKMGMDMGEEGVDLGGVQQEFFRLAIAKALDPYLGFFDVDPTTQMAWFRPYAPAPLIQFALVGMLFGLAVYNSITLPVTFPEVFYRLLLRRPHGRVEECTLSDLKDGWPVVYKSLESLLAYEGDDVEDVFSLDYSFPAELTGQTVALDMNSDIVPANAESAAASAARTSQSLLPVTNSNRADFVRDYVSWLLDKSVRPQVTAFLEGFHSVVSDRTLTLFRNGLELKDAVEGTQEIRIGDLKRITRYLDGYSEGTPLITKFWQIVEGYSQDQLRRLFEFVTASQRVPAAGIQDVSFMIQKNGSDDERLPTSMTCFGRLLLPHYSSIDVLKERLRVALENCEGFGVA